MCASGRMQHDPQLFGRFFTRESLIQMIDRLSLFEAAKEYTHPISNLLWYSKLGKTRNQYSSAREIFDEIMQKFGVPVPVEDTQTVNFLTPTALSPTAPSPTVQSYTEKSQNSYESMSPSVFRMYDYDNSVSYNLKPQKIFDESMVDDSISDRSLGGRSGGGGRGKTKKNKKKLRRNKSTRR